MLLQSGGKNGDKDNYLFICNNFNNHGLDSTLESMTTVPDEAESSLYAELNEMGSH